MECHSSSIHEFAPIDKTCAQSQCHADNPVQLGEMGELTIHCAACHNFVAPVAQDAGILGNEVDAAVLPDYDDCLTCHVMRTLVELPEPDPHRGTCAACHDPHTQTEPEQAVDSCSSAGCHEDPASETPFHRGLDQETGCLECHSEHDFSLDASDCASCHEQMQPVPEATLSDGTPFGHADHETVGCATCHVSDTSHGASTLVTVEDCRACHHTPPVVEDCARCHVASEAPTTVHARTLDVHLDLGVDDPGRTVTFPHESHRQLDCASCHTEGQALEPPPDLDCRNCHEDHHTPVSDCASCHRPAPIEAHPPDQAHVTCSGSGCHTDVPFEGLPRTRELCLGCHQDLRDHEPDRTCADCHTLPAPRDPGGAP